MKTTTFEDLKGAVYMKKMLRILAAAAAAAGAAMLLKLAAEVLSSCSHKYINVEAE